MEEKFRWAISEEDLPEVYMIFLHHAVFQNFDWTVDLQN